MITNKILGIKIHQIIALLTSLEICRKSCRTNLCLPTLANVLTLRILFLTTWKKWNISLTNLRWFQKRIENFNKDLKMFEQNSKDYFYFTILYAVYYALLDNKEDFKFCQSEDKFVEVFGKIFFEELKGKRDTLRLDLNSLTFYMQCQVINDILMNKKLFLRVYKLWKKFHYLIKKVPQKKNIAQRDLLACVEERFNGFDIVRKLTENEENELYRSVSIVYKSVSKIDQIINCYFLYKKNRWKITWKLVARCPKLITSLRT